MAKDDIPEITSPTILSVIDRFTTDMQSENVIDGQVIDRLEKLLLTGKVPKQEELAMALFDYPVDGES